ncbi:hypothetical protein NLM59_04585 [Weeksellaceae bacterium KMM 9724]|uniref:hypothetical protein n=1 Tax=Profundicola chukchiensis TaxID=2961959 RepID=UPI002437B0A4|nr:hypothetical protein [Profundicola chukchiensis]MDG4950191.1 hypothetical protein [Profundicola chukchiensis]
MIKHILAFTFIALILSCNLTNDSSCAEVQVYNPSSRSNRTYILKVDVESGELVKIYWPNGGWLDDYHFDPPSISGGKASFVDNQDKEYQVKLIKNSNCDW